MTEILALAHRYRRGLAVAGAGAAVFLFFSADVPAHLASMTNGGPAQISRPADIAMAPASSRTTPPTLSANALASMLGSDQWLNVSPLQAKDVRGKVVLVNFWTYSCINSLRPLPYLNAWAEKYRERGLVVVGVHTPEFEFEKDIGNVRQAVRQLGIDFPIRIDSDSTIWRKFGNRAWPGFYFIDANGRVRHHSFGEGNYDDAERVIEKLLNEADGKSATGPIKPISGQGIQAAPSWTDLHTPETYLGYARAENFVSALGVRKDIFSQYQAPSQPALNHWSLGGKWRMGKEFALLGNQAGTIKYRFHARDLHLVLGAPATGQPVSFRVTIDGAAPGVNHGADVDERGWGIVREDRLYQLVRQKGPVVDRTFQIEFLAPGVRAYAFTFG